MGMDITLYKILKPTKANLKKLDEATGVYFVNTETLLETKTGKQLIAKYADYLTTRDVEIWDINAIKRSSKFFAGENSLKYISVRWVGCGTRTDGHFYEDFELTCGQETQKLFIKPHDIAPFTITETGFIYESVKYLQRKGIQAPINTLHPDFKDFKQNYYIYANTQEHLEALQNASNIKDSDLCKLKEIKNLHFIDLNA